MGVRGLTTYINFNENVFLHMFYLHDSCLIIDGHSLCAQLYRRLNCFSAFGGDYDKFAAYVRTFFKNLRKCNITSYVIFDGSYEQRKLKTAYSRLRSKISGASRLDPVTQGCLQIFPLLIRDVFIEALKDMSVPYTVCEFEADDEIAAMARYINCPVLSYDSDFFIYNVQYIPFNTLETKPKLLGETGENKKCVLECKIYRVEHMTKHFGGLDEELLPLLATLLGNDFVEKKVFRKFFTELKIPKSKKKRNDQQKCIHGLFKWLQNETLESAISKIIGRLKKNQKEKVLWVIKKSIEGYKKDHCQSLKYFDIHYESNKKTEITLEFEIDSTSNYNETDGGEDLSVEDSSSSSEDSNGEEDKVDQENSLQDTNVGVPDWYAEKLRSNKIPKPYLNLYTHHLYFYSPQAEDYTDNDCFLPCLPILRYSYDILTDFSQDTMAYVGRNELTYKRLPLGTEYSISRPFDISFSDLTDEQLKLYFHIFLQKKMELLDIGFIETLPENFQLVMIAILWWVANCSVPLAHVHSIIMCYVMLEVIDAKTGTFRGHHFFNNKYSKKLEQLKTNLNKDYEDIEVLNKNKVQYEDCLIAASVLLKHFELDDKIKKKPKTYDSKKMHSFAQFQCCLMQINSLNTLCSSPLQSTKYCSTFNGTFIYNIAVKLENQTDPYLFFKDYLKGSTTVILFYRSICKVFDKCIEKMGIETVKWSASGKRRRRRKRNTEMDEINFIVKGFESEVVI